MKSSINTEHVGGGRITGEPGGGGGLASLVVLMAPLVQFEL